MSAAEEYVQRGRDLVGRRGFLGLMAGGGTVGFLSAFGCAKQQVTSYPRLVNSSESRNSRPNLLFVMADQFRGQDMGCAGNPYVHTPTFDRLAAEGTYCPLAYANAPVCTPSRGTMLTGQFPLTHRALANDMPLPVDTPTLTSILQGSGYRTGYIGKWHLDGVPRSKFTPPGPRRHGIEYWAAHNCSHDYFRVAKFYRDTRFPEFVDGYEPAVQTNLAQEFLEHADDRPFCLFVSWGPPHSPYDKVPAAYRAMYDPKQLPLRPNVPPRTKGGKDPREKLALYYAAITALDDQMAQLLAMLEASGHADNTIVVFTSDHGDMLGSQGWWKKQQPWEESVRIPLIVRWPAGMSSGRVLDTPISTVDYAPTLLRMLGVETPVHMQGRDRSADVLGTGQEDGPDRADDSAFLMNVVPIDDNYRKKIREWRAIRTKRYTYATHINRRGWLLYDNEADPYQLTNLIGHPAYAKQQRELAERLDGWLTRTGDQFQTGAETLRSLDLAGVWNARQYAMSPSAPRLV